LTAEDRQRSGYFSDSFFNELENQIQHTAYLSKTTLAVAIQRPIGLALVFVMPNGVRWW